DDVESLAPHADVDEQRGHPGDHQVGAEALPPEDLRHDDVAEHHQPEDRGEGAGPAHLEEHVHLVAVAAVPRDEVLHHVDVADHHARRSHDLVHVHALCHG